ncbi:hypothetical protein [Novosphingobium sp. SG720]|uniref:hypothetical protein n=1 Tax=Novosphingobium sp. SG720 TaxID=2586998 RepID=UPI001446F5A6|nr:hypothetical protein [Novosphingobium sp. SG720]NKJ42194.1 hypothetical protein [Novosphingobium sp. SG720]
MTIPFPFPGGRRSGTVASALALLLSAASAPALAQGQQPPAGPPPGVSATQAPPAGGADGPPAQGGQLRLPPGASAGPPAGSPPPGPVLTPAQKLVAELPPPGPGVLPPRPPLPADAAMPASDPRDFQGTWFNNQPLQFRSQKDIYGAPAPYTMEGAKVLARRVKSLVAGTPFINASAICRPPGPQWQRDLNFPFLITQTRDYVEFVFEEYHGRWYISLDPQRAPLPVAKQYMGRSVGHWDGNTLVVESSDFRQAIWLDVDGTPLSAKGKLIQRIRKVDDGGHVPFLEIATTIVDPTYYTAPWTIVRSYGWIPHQAVFAEYNCEEQVGDPSVSPDAGLVPEPQE